MNVSRETTGVFSFARNLIIFLVFGLAIYYLYQYFYAVGSQQSYVLLAGKNKADSLLKKTDGKTPLNPITGTSLPGVYEGGQFSVEFWIYVSNWNIKLGKNKHIFSLGGQNFDTIRIYLAPFKSDLRVRVHTKESNLQLGSGTGTAMLSSSPVDKNMTEDLPASNRNSTFTDLNVDSQLTASEPICDVADLDLQRWLHVVVTVSNRTVDTYIDGKLARSCVLPTFYKVDTNYMAYITEYGGFGGYISNVTLYDYSLSPDLVYHNYMAGPGAAAGTLWDWIKSFFVPSAPDIQV